MRKCKPADPFAVALAAAARCSVAQAEALIRAHQEAIAAAWCSVLPPRRKP